MNSLSTQQAQKAPLWVSGDWNAFFGLGTNSLLNILILSGLLINVIQLPTRIVFGQIIPAVGTMLALSNFYYAWMARRLAQRTGRIDVTALPAGPSVPHMFFITLAIMLPAKIVTGDPIAAWRVGMAWVFIEGIVNMTGSFIAPFIRAYTPRAALLGTLAGVSLVFISVQPAMEIMQTPWLGLTCLIIILGSWFSKVRLLGNVPAGLIVVVLGVIFGWATGLMQLEPLLDATSSFALSLPSFAVEHLLGGFEQLAPLLVTAIPFGIYDFLEALDNVESASAAGDEYNVREVLFVDGITSLIGTLLGSPFANAVYIGHPGWKSAGGRIGYSIATGAFVLIITLFGIVPLLLSLIPLVAILPILLYIGVLITAQAFQSTPKLHAPAIVMAIVPHFGAWGLNLVNSTLSAANLSVEDVSLASLGDAGVLYDGLQLLGGGAILVGLIWGAVTVSLLDRTFIRAASFALMGAVLSFFGFMHGEQLGFNVKPSIALGYVLMSLVCLTFHFSSLRQDITSDTAAG